MEYSKCLNRRFSARQLVWLKLECPLDGSLKSLYSGFLMAVDSLLATSFYDYYGQSERANKTQLATAVAIVASITGLGIHLIDPYFELRMVYDLTCVWMDKISHARFSLMFSPRYSSEKSKVSRTSFVAELCPKNLLIYPDPTLVGVECSGLW